MKYLLIAVFLLFSLPANAQYNNVLNDWHPPIHPAPNGGSNYFNSLFTYSAGLGGSGSIADRWLTSDYVYGTFIVTDHTLADSHLIGFNCIIIMPAGLGDGQGGQFVGNFPTNPNYQETGCYDGTIRVSSPGHGVEGIGMVVSDNDGSSPVVPGVPAPMVAVLGVVNKNAASNQYPSEVFHAVVTGIETGPYAPDSFFRADGFVKVAIDLSNSTNINDISLQNGMVLSHDDNYLYISKSGVQGLAVSTAGIVVPSMQIGGKTVTVGAPDSGGIGYRTLVVPN